MECGGIPMKVGPTIVVCGDVHMAIKTVSII